MKPSSNKRCIAQWKIDADRSVLNEQRAIGKPWSDFPKHWKAAAIQRNTFTAIKAVEGVKIPEGPVLWFTPDKTEAVVDVAFSSDLVVVDLPGLKVGESKTVGTLSPERALHAVNYGQEILELLLRADILRTYWHIGSEVCITSSARDETMISGGYRAEVSGEHTYFTNEENNESFAFRFEISPSGAISVTGLQ